MYKRHTSQCVHVLKSSAEALNNDKSDHDKYMKCVAYDVKWEMMQSFRHVEAKLIGHGEVVIQHLVCYISFKAI